MSRILLTGGSGLLGREILKLDPSLIAPSHAELDVANFSSVFSELQRHAPRVVLHLAAANKPPEHEKDPEPGLKINIIGTANLALACHRLNIRLVYVSTDFVYTGPGPHKEEEAPLPPSRFAWSKLGGECAMRLLPDFLILRVDFGPVPFPWEKVYSDCYVSKLYADEIAPLVVSAARSAVSGVMNIGGPRTTLEAYARRTRPNIETIPKPEWVPEDTSLDLTKMRVTLGVDDESKLLKH